VVFTRYPFPVWIGTMYGHDAIAIGHPP